MKRMPALAIAVALVALVPAVPASADTLPVSIYANVWIESWTGTVAQICGEGNVNNGQPPVTAQWTFALSAVRSDGTTYVASPITSWGDIFSPQCQYVSTGATPNGVFTAQLSAVAVDAPDLSGMDVTGVAGLAATWSPSDPHPQAFRFTSPY